MQQNRESWSSAPDSRGYVGWSLAPPLTSSGHCHQAYHTLPEDSRAPLLILRGYDGWSFAPPLTSYPTRGSWSYAPDSRRHNGWSFAPPLLLYRGATTQVAPGLPLDRSGRRAGAKRLDVLLWDRSRPATILMSPGQARQTIRAYHLVVRRPREGCMLACMLAC